MLKASGQVWVKAIVLSTGATALLAAFVGLLHLRIGETSSEPTNGVTVCDCVVDDPRQTAIAMVRSSDRRFPSRQRTYLVGLDLSSPPTRLAIPFDVLEPISVAAGPDGQLLVAAVDGGVYFINPKRPCDDPVVITRHQEPPFQIVCSPDGRWLLTVESKQLCVWDLPSRKLQWKREGSIVCSVALVPNTDVIVCGMADGSVAELSLKTGDDLRRINRHPLPVMKLTVSSQGDRVASYCAGQEIRVTDRLTGASIWQYRAGKYGLPLIKFSRDGRLLITAELVECRWTARVWDLESAECPSDLRGHIGALVGAELLSDEELLTWSANGELCRWSLADGDLLQTTCLARWFGQRRGDHVRRIPLCE